MVNPYKIKRFLKQNPELELTLTYEPMTQVFIATIRDVESATPMADGEATDVLEAQSMAIDTFQNG